MFAGKPAAAFLAGMALSAAVPAWASGVTPGLTAKADARACGGSIGCGFAQTVHGSGPAAVNAYEADSRYFNDTSAGATASFGLMRTYANAYATTRYAYSEATAEVVDVVPANEITGGLYHFGASLDGVMTNAGAYVAGDGILDNIDFVASLTDDVTGAFLGRVTYEVSSPAGDYADVIPPTPVILDFAVPAGHGVDIDAYLDAFAYTTPDGVLKKDYKYVGPVLVTVDFSHTLTFTLKGPQGSPDLVGLSGHDYSRPPVTGVPEPTTWALLTAGFALAGASARLRRRATAA